MCVRLSPRSRGVFILIRNISLMKTTAFVIFSHLYAVNSAAFVGLKFNILRKGQDVLPFIGHSRSYQNNNLPAAVVSGSVYRLQTVGSEKLRGPLFQQTSANYGTCLRPKAKTALYAGDTEGGLSDDEILIPQGDWREARARL